MPTTRTTTMERDEIPRFREWLKEILRTGTTTVTFRKSDGSIRVMRCSLDPTVVPAKPVTEGETTVRRINNDVLPVWDVEAGAWKSFRLDRVTEVTHGE